MTREIAMGLATAICSALRECLGPSALQSLVGREPCEQRFAASYSQNSLGLLEDSAARERIVLHTDKLEQCYRDTAALGCSAQRSRPPSSCSQAIEGRVAISDTCSSGWECSGDAFCSQGECPRSCVERLAAGSTCNSENECASGLMCVDKKCVEPAPAGSSCAGTTGVVCELGTACVGGTEQKAGVCRANSEILVAELGERCDLDATYCREGLSCAFDGVALSCQNPVSSGEACHLAAPAQCPIEEYCNAARIDLEGRCQRLPTDGEACVLAAECAAGYACVAEAGKPVCRPLRDLGESCAQDAECRSGRCADAHCSVAVVCE